MNTTYTSERNVARMNDVVVIGGGAAGMMAALYALRGGASVTLLERNEKLGKKIYITGKGRCNLTNVAEETEFMGNIVRNPRFLFAALSLLNNNGVMELFEGLGVKLKVERGGRVFPESDHASDITRGLDRELHRLGCRVRLNTRVASLLQEEGRVTGVELETGETLKADAVIVATGGQSYPTTGSTGDGWRFAEETGHASKPAIPALTPIETEETWPYALSGLSLKNVRLTAPGPKKKPLYSEQGEMLLTHFGISGPLALSASSYLPEESAGAKLILDLKPALTDEMLDQRLLRDFKEMSRKQIISVMDGLAPHALAMAILEMCGIAPAHPVNGITQEMRAAIIRNVKHIELTVKRLRPLTEAIVTRGGVSVKDVNPSTMASKRIAGLYFAGETLDIDALTGGCNLQLAFSTGALAGSSAAQEER